MSKVLKAVKIVSKGMKKFGRSSVQIVGQSLTFNDFDQLLRIGLLENQATELNYSSVEEFELCAFDEQCSPLSRIGRDFQANELIRSLEWCNLATDNESSRCALGGVLWDENHIVGTDGRRMHCVRIGACDNLAKPFTAIIPQRIIKALAQLVKLFKDDIVSVRITEKEVVFCGDCWQLCSRLIEGRYPNWQKVIEPLELSGEPKLINVPSLVEQIARIAKRVQLESKIALASMAKSERKNHIEPVPQLRLDEQILDARFVREALDIVGEKYVEYRQERIGSAINIGDSRICYSDRYATLAVIMPMSK